MFGVKLWRVGAAGLLSAFVLCGCDGGISPVPAPTATATETAAPPMATRTATASATASAAATASPTPEASATPTMPALAQACLDAGGSLSTSLCCASAGDFPDTCAIGACGCSPQSSAETTVCQCPAGQCFDGGRCVPAAT